MNSSAPPSSLPIRIRYLGRQDYAPVWLAMQEFTRRRNEETPDEIWLLEHPPVYTLGQAGKPEHLLRPNGIPVVPIDRGGQVTYHGPGQIVAYLLLDIRRLGISVRTLVDRMEQALIDLLAEYQILAERRPGAPGVYVQGAKIAALGLRIRRGKSYHGLSFNVDMDLSPFQDINPCGYQGLAVTQARDLGIPADPAALARQLATHLTRQLGYARAETIEEAAVNDC